MAHDEIKNREMLETIPRSTNVNQTIVLKII